ncbi:MAG: YihY/virulence factor BrkB family protein [Ilumatobacteraceae bacterium]|nr:YihY/virulence factor BrkB family protein [Ilumatobacteraceae bacterium]
MPWTTSPRVMELRAKSAPADIAVGTLDGWRRHLSGRNASVLSLFGFLTIFPLLLVATTILGFVLEGNQSLQDRIVDGSLKNIPVIGQQLAEDPASVDGNLWALIIGLVAALWSSTKAFVGIQGALDDIWEVDVDNRASMPVQRGRALLGILCLGIVQVGSMSITVVVNAASLPGFGRSLLVLATLAINIGMLAAMYRYLTSAKPAWNDVWPGAVAAGIVFSLLQYFGTAIVQRISDNASDTYGSFAIVLGLITWIGLLAISALMCAELNAAIARHRNRSGIVPTS